MVFNTDYYGHAVNGAAYPWCCAFVWDIFRMCGASDLFCGGKKTAFCPYVMQYAKGNGAWITGSYKPGDLALFDFGGDGVADHIGIIEEDKGKTVVTIEGNTSADNKGSQSNGGVFERTRKKNLILGAFRPAYQQTGWVQNSGWFYFDEDGELVRDKWIVYKGKDYYLKLDGSMAADEYIKCANYDQRHLLWWVDGNGICNEKNYKWTKDSRGWMLSGVQTAWTARSEWAKIDGKWYYFGNDGYMLTGKHVVDGGTYVFDDEGALIE